MKRAQVSMSVPASVLAIMTGTIDEDGVFHVESWELDTSEIDVGRRDIESELYSRLPDDTLEAFLDVLDEDGDVTMSTENVSVTCVEFNGDLYGEVTP